MEKRSRLVLLLLLATFALEIAASSLEILSQVDLDSAEDEATANTLKLDSKESRKESMASGLSTIRLRSNGESGFAREPRKRRIRFNQIDPTKPPIVFNNVRIVVNGNESRPGSADCKDGVCDVFATSRIDDDGNIVTDVHLSIVTRLNENVKVGDIPVIDGTRGAEATIDRRPTFHLSSPPRAYQHFYFNNIPQIQGRRPEGGEHWYQGTRSFQRPQAPWHYHNYGERPIREFQGHGSWVPSRPPVDDKIEPPLSETRPANE
ncbi:hypothetical protein KM043_007475 [Ampulex compressa]|nr:hypothetical protein KM043_007475 [Ampulex compressa]